MDFALRDKLEQFLAEDMGTGDITTELLVEPEDVEAEVVCHQEGVLAGIQEATELLELAEIQVLGSGSDGSSIRAGDVVLRVLGENRRILAVERTLLNLLSRMSGIATLTAEYVREARLGNPRVKVAATRKTGPGLRRLDKKAVVVGGGDSHRMSLSDAVLIKDNHIDAVGDLVTCIRRAKAGASYMHRIEVEVSSTEDALLAAEEGVDVVMLDNMSLDGIKEAVGALRSRFPEGGPKVEVSGGISLENIRDIAAAGPDAISVGRLTHSPKSLDFSLRLVTDR